MTQLFEVVLTGDTTATIYFDLIVWFYDSHGDPWSTWRERISP